MHLFPLVFGHDSGGAALCAGGKAKINHGKYSAPISPAVSLRTFSHSHAHLPHTLVFRSSPRHVASDEESKHVMMKVDVTLSLSPRYLAGHWASTTGYYVHIHS